MSRTSRKGIDRIVPGVGRITIRGGRLKGEVRDELDRAICLAAEAGHIEPLRLLKGRRVTPLEFIQASRKNQLLALAQPLPLRELVDQWLATSDLRDSSRKRYEQSFRFVLASLSADPKVQDLTTAWWAKFVEWRTTQGPLTASTLNRDRAAVHAFLNWAREAYDGVPVFKTRRRVEEPRRSGILTRFQVEAVRRHSTPEQWLFFETLLATGARQGELLNLVRSDVEGDRLTILSRLGAKSRGKERTISIPRRLAETLRFRGELDTKKRVFPYSRRTIQQWWQQVSKAAGIQGVTLHGLRATVATQALDAGIQPVAVQKLLGHSSLGMTLRYYRNTEQDAAIVSRIRGAVGLEEEGNEREAQKPQTTIVTSRSHSTSNIAEMLGQA